MRGNYPRKRPVHSFLSYLLSTYFMFVSFSLVRADISPSSRQHSASCCFRGNTFVVQSHPADCDVTSRAPTVPINIVLTLRQTLILQSTFLLLFYFLKGVFFSSSHRHHRQILSMWCIFIIGWAINISASNGRYQHRPEGDGGARRSCALKPTAS